MANPNLSALVTKGQAKGWRSYVGPWVQDNIAASQTDIALKRAAAANTGTEFVPDRPGSIVGIGASFTVAPAGSTLTLKVTKNGSVIANCALSVTAGATLGRSTTFASGLYTFAAGDRISMAINTDGSWTAITSDLVADIEIETN